MWAGGGGIKLEARGFAGQLGRAWCFFLEWRELVIGFLQSLAGACYLLFGSLARWWCLVYVVLALRYDQQCSFAYLAGYALLLALLTFGPAATLGLLHAAGSASRRHASRQGFRVCWVADELVGLIARHGTVALSISVSNRMAM